MLAYGSLITPDLASVVALLGSTYVFWRWIRDPSWAWSFALGGTIALAILIKSVWLMLPFVFLAIWGAASIKELRFNSNEPERKYATPRLACLSGGRLVLAFVLALLITNSFYGFQGSLVPLGDFRFVSQKLAGIDGSAIAIPDCPDCEPKTVASAEKGNRFEHGALSGIPVPLPANYLQGIDIQIRDFERGSYDPNWQSYLLGEWKQGGWWYYYVLGLIW